MNGHFFVERSMEQDSSFYCVEIGAPKSMSKNGHYCLNMDIFFDSQNSSKSIKSRVLEELKRYNQDP